MDCFAELLPFDKNPKKRLLQLSLSFLIDRLQKVLLSRDRETERERERERYLHRQSLEMLGHFCGTVMAKREN